MTAFALKEQLPTNDVLSMDDIKQKLTPVFQKYQVKRAYLFGSYARGEATIASDVDIRVEPGENDCLRSLFQASSMWQDLQEALGRDVDFLTCLPDKKQDRAFYDNILRDEVLIYGAPIERFADSPTYSEVRLSS